MYGKLLQRCANMLRGDLGWIGALQAPEVQVLHTRVII